MRPRYPFVFRQPVRNHAPWGFEVRAQIPFRGAWFRLSTVDIMSIMLSPGFRSCFQITDGCPPETWVFYRFYHSQRRTRPRRAGTEFGIRKLCDEGFPIIALKPARLV